MRQLELPSAWPGLMREYENRLDAQYAADMAIKQVEKNASVEWLRVALLCVIDVARVMPTFTTDDVWERVGLLGVTTHEPRAMGSVMRRAVKDGVCVATPSYERSSRVECHARPVRVWRSLL